MVTPRLMKKKLMRMIQMLVLRLTCTKDHRSRGKLVLKKDADSIAHLLTHRYRNPFCESCVKAKLRHFRSRTGAFKREVKTFGDLVKFDFVTASGDHEVEGRCALIVRDIYTGFIMAYPTARRDTDSVVRAIKHLGERSNRCTRMLAQS